VFTLNNRFFRHQACYSLLPAKPGGQADRVISLCKYKVVGYIHAAICYLYTCERIQGEALTVQAYSVPTWQKFRLRFSKGCDLKLFRAMKKSQKRPDFIHSSQVLHAIYGGVNRCIRCFSNKTLWQLNFLMQKIFSPTAYLFVRGGTEKSSKALANQLQGYLINSFFQGKANSLSGFLPSDIQGLYTEQGAVLLDRLPLHSIAWLAICSIYCEAEVSVA
jgi:hypothetical protein